MGNGKVFCAEYCPTTLTEDTKPSCTGTPGTVFSTCFNSFIGPWIDNGVTATLADHKPAKQRGHYIGTNDTPIVVSDLKMHLNFALTAWIRIENISSERVIFSKTDKTFQMFMKWAVNDGKLQLTLLKWFDTKDKTTEAKDGLTIMKDKDWHFVGLLLKINTDDARSSFATLKVNGATDAELTFSDLYYFLDWSYLDNLQGDDYAPLDSTVGGLKTGDDTYTK